MRIAKSCVFAFNSNIDLVARPGLAEAESFFRKKIVSGGEIEVDAETAERLAAAFEWKEMRMGGQAGNMANAAAALGVKCLAHAYNLSPRQKGLFAKGVRVVGDRTGEESCHYILELVLRNGLRDRLIASHDPAHYDLKIAREFAPRSAEFISEGCDRAIVSGFHILRAKNAKERLLDAAHLMRRWRKANPKLRIHFEAGDFARKEVIADVAKIILPLVDSVGVNEKELREFASHLEDSEVGEVVIHTAGYASAISRIRSRESLANALRFGHALAAFKAQTGRYAGMREAMGMLRERGAGTLPSKFGVTVPAFRITPKITVGLGDSFAAGCFLAE